MSAKLAVAALAVCSTAFAGDRDFDQIVKAIESHYGVSRTHLPLMGVANFFTKAAHPKGISGFRLAIFEDLPSSEDSDLFMDGLTPSGLHRMVKVRSRHDGESTYIFAGEPGKSTRLLIATFGRNEATVVEVKADMNALVKLLGDPTHMGKALGGDRDEHSPREAS